MKQISAALQAHIQGEVTTLATCWKLTRRDGAVMGFTDHDQPVIFEGISYQASSGFTPSAIQSSASLSVDNLDIEGMLSDGSVTESDILVGKYDFSEIEIFQVNYNDLTQGALKLRRGWFGEVSLYKQQFVAEIRGLTQRLSQTIGELYSPSCRATLGDSRCKVDMTAQTVSGSVTGVASNLEFFDTGRTEATAVFSFGVVTFTSGANSGLSMEIKEYSYATGGAGTLILALPMPYAIAVGDGYSLTKGCDKTIATCFSSFNNVANFRGEPSMPGLDSMLETAGTFSASS